MPPRFLIKQEKSVGLFSGINEEAGAVFLGVRKGWSYEVSVSNRDK